MRSAVALGVALALCSPRALAQATPEPVEADPTARTHDGFYLRLSLGGGALKAKFSGGAADDTEVSGGGAMIDVLIGGTPVSSLVVGGGYQFEMAQDAEYDSGSSSGTGNLARGVLGPFVEWFPDRHGGFSVGLLAGYTFLMLDTVDIRIFGTQVDNDIRSYGVGGNLWVGYAHWLSRQWSLGLMARGGLASTKNMEDSSQSGAATSFGVLVTGVHH